MLRRKIEIGRTWPIARWQKPRMSLLLYSESADCSMRRIVTISLYIFRRPSLVTSTSREGASVLWPLKESS
jgi:hypothetical protein